MKKKMGYYFRVVLLLFAVSPLFSKVVEAEEQITSDGYVYTEHWEGDAYSITGYQGEGGEITIPGKINGKKVKSISGFMNNDTITKITIGEGVVSLGNEAFGNCSQVTQIMIPASLESVSNAFVSCHSLEKFTVAKKNKKFYTIDGVLIGKYPTGVSLAAYPGGRKGSYTIPKKVTQIGEQSFFGAVNLSKITIPKTCKEMYPNAFDGCTSLTTVDIKSGGIKYLGYKAFANCTSLKQVNISADISGMDSAFVGCTTLKKVKLDKKNPYMLQKKGVLYSTYKNYRELFVLLGEVTLDNGVYTVPSNIYRVSGGAFGAVEGLESVDFSKSKVEEFHLYQWKGFKGNQIIVKKGSKLAESIRNEDTLSSDEGIIKVKYVK